MVAMGRALMSQPRLLLMDEPSMGLAPILVERSFEIIKQVNDSGVAMLVVEQNANVSLSIADRGYVLSTGRIVLEGAGRRPAGERGPAEGLPWPLTTGTDRLVGAARPRASSRSSRARPTSTRARRAPSRTASGRRSRSGSPAGTRTAPSGTSGSSGTRRSARPSRGCSTPGPTRSPSRRRSRRA